MLAPLRLRMRGASALRQHRWVRGGCLLLRASGHAPESLPPARRSACPLAYQPFVRQKVHLSSAAQLVRHHGVSGRLITLYFIQIQSSHARLARRYVSANLCACSSSRSPLCFFAKIFKNTTRCKLGVWTCFLSASSRTRMSLFASLIIRIFQLVFFSAKQTGPKC